MKIQAALVEEAAKRTVDGRPSLGVSSSEIGTRHRVVGMRWKGCKICRVGYCPDVYVPSLRGSIHGTWNSFSSELLR